MTLSWIGSKTGLINYFFKETEVAETEAAETEAAETEAAETEAALVDQNKQHGKLSHTGFN